MIFRICKFFIFIVLVLILLVTFVGDTTCGIFCALGYGNLAESTKKAPVAFLGSLENPSYCKQGSCSAVLRVYKSWKGVRTGFTRVNLQVNHQACGSFSTFPKGRKFVLLADKIELSASGQAPCDVVSQSSCRFLLEKDLSQEQRQFLDSLPTAKLIKTDFIQKYRCIYGDAALAKALGAIIVLVLFVFTLVFVRLRRRRAENKGEKS